MYIKRIENCFRETDDCSLVSSSILTPLTVAIADAAILSDRCCSLFLPSHPFLSLQFNSSPPFLSTRPVTVTIPYPFSFPLHSIPFLSSQGISSPPAIRILHSLHSNFYLYLYLPTIPHSSLPHRISRKNNY